MYYTRKKIKVKVHPLKPEDYNLVDLTFLSSTEPKNGIVVIDEITFKEGAQRAIEELEKNAIKLPKPIATARNGILKLDKYSREHPGRTRAFRFILFILGLSGTFSWRNRSIGDDSDNDLDTDDLNDGTNE
ncbi:MAG: hypothetical protein WDO14_21965 [Bacteroidota bacterium]